MEIDWDHLQQLAVNYALKLIFAVLVLLIGWWIINKVVKAAGKWMIKRKWDVSLRPFLITVIKLALRILLIIAVAGMVGIQMTSFIAVLGASGLAIGLALQGSLSNFAGGVIILVLRPFKVGEYINFNGKYGTVREIQLFHTYLTTDNKQELIVPNGTLANTAILNFSRHDSRGMGMEIKIGKNEDIELKEIKRLFTDLLHQEKALVGEPVVFLKKIDADFMTYGVHAYFKTTEYWEVYFSLIEKVKNLFDKEGISIPHPTIKEVNLLLENPNV